MDDIFSILVTMDYPDAITYGLRRQTDHIEGSHQVHLDYLAEMVEWCGTVFTEDLNKKVNSRNEINPRVKRVERPLLLPYTSSR